MLTTKLGCIVSIGTGVSDLRSFGDDPLAISKTLQCIATDTEKTASKFHRFLSSFNCDDRYYRFNVARGLALIGLEEASEARNIKERTDFYLQEPTIHKFIKKCAKALGNPVISNAGTIQVTGAQSTSRWFHQSMTDDAIFKLVRAILPI